MRTILLLFVLLLLSACATLPEKIQENIQEHKFTEALLLLEEEGVGVEVLPDADEEALLARKIYEEAIEEYYNNRINTEVAAGKLRSAKNYALEAQRLCSWSREIEVVVKDISARVHFLDTLQGKWHLLANTEEISLEEAEDVASDILPVYEVIHDSPQLVRLMDKAALRVMHHWATRLKEAGSKMMPRLVHDFAGVLEGFPNISGRQSFLQGLTDFTKLPKLHSSPSNASLAVSSSGQHSLDALIAFFADDHNGSYLLDECHAVLQKLFSEWCDKELALLLARADVTFSLIASAENVLINEGIEKGAGFTNVLAEAHMRRAESRARDGNSAALALLHIQRVRHLDSVLYNRKSERVVQLARASLRVSEPIEVTVAIDGYQYIDPGVYTAVKNVFAVMMNSATNSYIKWVWLHPDSQQADIRVAFSEIKAFIADGSALKTVKSKYFSHYQNAPNPEKKSAYSRMQWAHSDIETAKRNYNNAVSSHNFNPTYNSLEYVNFTYTQYAMAIDTYNTLVRQYNATPATVEESVYLPYTFEEGTIRSGWAVAAQVVANETSWDFSEEQIDTDFVRRGTRTRDVNPRYRKEDRVDIDISQTEMANKLERILTNLLGRVGYAFTHLDLRAFPRVEKEEKVLLSTIFHPFGAYFPAGTPPWVVSALRDFALPETIVAPVARQLVKSTVTTDTENLEEFIAHHEVTVCEVRDEMGHGSGTLISGDGLILTCAHVLNGSALSVIFHNGTHKGEYPAEILFVDTKNDVALIRAKGLTAKQWAAVRLHESSRKGEKIVAIGNPSPVAGVTVTSGATQGLIAQPEISAYGTKRTVGDITIASGSSGGPIFSLKTGEVVAVVTAVVNSGILQDSSRAASGYFCLGAPATQLPEWLGLRYR